MPAACVLPAHSWSTDSHRLLTASNDWTAVLWDVLSATVLREVRCHSVVLCAELCPRNPYVPARAAPPPPARPRPSTHLLATFHGVRRDLALVVSFNAMVVDFEKHTSVNVVEPPAPKATGLPAKRKSGHGGKRVSKAPTGVVCPQRRVLFVAIAPRQWLASRFGCRAADLGAVAYPATGHVLVRSVLQGWGPSVRGDHEWRTAVCRVEHEYGALRG